jgi:hypothetical protein
MLHHDVVYLSEHGIAKYWMLDLGYRWDETREEMYAAPIDFLDVEAEARRQAEAIRQQWLAVRIIEIACEGKRQAQPLEIGAHEYVDTWGIICPLNALTVHGGECLAKAPEIKLWTPRGKVGMGFKHPRETHYNPLCTATWSQRFQFVCWFDSRKVPSRDMALRQRWDYCSLPASIGKCVFFWSYPHIDRIRIPLPKPNEYKTAEHGAAGVTIKESSGGSAWRGELLAKRWPWGFFPQREDWYPDGGRLAKIKLRYARMLRYKQLNFLRKRNPPTARPGVCGLRVA